MRHFLFFVDRIGFIAFALALSGIAPVDAAEIPAARRESLQQRFGGVKAWEISLRYAGDNPLHASADGFVRDRSVWQETSRGLFVLPVEPGGGDTVRIRGEGSTYDTLEYYCVDTAPGRRRTTRYDRGAGETRVSVDILLDFNTGTCEVSFVPGKIPTVYGGQEITVHETRTIGPHRSTSHILYPGSGFTALPDSGDVISGRRPWEDEPEKSAAPFEPSMTDHALRQPARGTLEWSLRPAALEPLEVDLIVEPANYDEWMPEAGADESTAGNSIALKATLVARDGGPLKTHAVHMNFGLGEASREKGVALNAPLENAAATPDLTFDAARNPREWTIGADGASIQTSDGRHTEATAVLSARDWGAFGTVVVTARLANGRSVRGRLAGADTPDVLIPKRSQGGRIADAWRRLHECEESDGADSDRQEGNTHLGDGLTVYEEYRGLILDRRHTRQTKQLHPQRKDLIVANALADTGRAGLAMFEQASGIHVVELRPAELPRSRLVNVNRGAASGGEQYGLLLRQDSVADGAGENRPAALLHKTPKLSEEVVIDIEGMTAFFQGQAAAADAAGEAMPYSLQEYMSNTIAHELAHGVGAPHHGRTTEYFGPREYTVRMRDWRVHGVDGRLLTPAENQPVPLTGRIGRPGNEASGDASCIMAYTNFYQWAALGPEDGPYRFYAIPLQPVGKTFCTHSAATGFNRPHTSPKGTSIPGFFGNAGGIDDRSPAGNCLGAMNVRDW